MFSSFGLFCVLQPQSMTSLNFLRLWVCNEYKWIWKGKSSEFLHLNVLFKLLSDVTAKKVQLLFLFCALSTGELKLRPICHATIPHYLPLCILCRHLAYTVLLELHKYWQGVAYMSILCWIMDAVMNFFPRDKKTLGWHIFLRMNFYGLQREGWLTPHIQTLAPCWPQRLMVLVYRNSEQCGRPDRHAIFMEYKYIFFLWLLL